MTPPPPGPIVVTGAGGFVGSAVIGLLAAQSTPVIALTSARRPPAIDGVHWISGDLFDSATLDQAMKGAAAVIHLVGIIHEHPRRGITYRRIHGMGTLAVMAAALRHDVKRFIQMSALGARPDAPSVYHQTKYQAEEFLRDSPLEWTIMRPSIIHGPRGEFMQMEFSWARGKIPPYLFMPYFGAGLLGGGGAGKIQPVFVDDVARAFSNAIENPKTIRQTYAIGGADQLTWPQMHHEVARALLGRRRLVAPVPVWLAKLMTHLAPAPLLPFNRAEIAMSQEPNTCDMTHFIRDFGWTPEGFSAALARYVHGNQ